MTLLDGERISNDIKEGIAIEVTNLISEGRMMVLAKLMLMQK